MRDCDVVAVGGGEVGLREGLATLRQRLLPRFERRLFRRLRLSSASAPDTDLELRIAATLRRESSLPYASRMSMRSVFFATTLRPSVTWKVTR